MPPFCPFFWAWWGRVVPGCSGIRHAYALCRVRTFDDLLLQMAEQEKKRRFVEETDGTEAGGNFVEMDCDVPDTG